MESILKDLINSYSEKRLKPKEFKFYSNLSITQPIKTHTEISTSISKGIQYLEKSISPKLGFQSYPFSDRNCTLPFISENPIPPEIYTNLLVLDLLCDSDSDQDQDSNSELKLNKKSLEIVRNFILPECGISTFNIFKPLKSSSPNSFEDSDDNESNISADSSYSSMPMQMQQSIIPDDCNTTAIALAVLLNEDILEVRPAGSITEILLSNVPTTIQENSETSSGNSDKIFKNYPEVPRAYLTCEGIDLVTCANILYIYYLLDYASLNFEEYVETTEIFLLQTLKSFLTSREEEDLHNQEELFTLHHSLDSLIYFLSRVTVISDHARDRFAPLLIALLDQRVGQETSRPLDLAMRILAADHLGILTNEGSTSMHCRINTDYEALTMLQNDKDGNWPGDSVFKIDMGYGKDVFFGGEVISTVFACKALDVYYDCFKAVKINKRIYKDFSY